MSQTEHKGFYKDAETEFRRRMTEKLRAQGLSGSALQARMEALLKSGVNLSLDEATIQDEVGHVPRMA